MANLKDSSTNGSLIAMTGPGVATFASMGGTMKIYMLMILVSTIAMLSHLSGRNQASETTGETAPN
jgi:hypothetical protein